MGMHELVEKIEHAHHEAGHGGGHGAGHGQKHDAGSSKQIGITMAMLGVMLAFSAAMVGSQRTELIKSMVEQSTKFGLYQAESTKYRVLAADLELLKSLSPKKDEIEKVEGTLRAKRRPSGAKDDEDTAELKDLIASATEDMADLLTPDRSEIKRFNAMAREYDKDMREAKEDAEAYAGAIEAHQEAAERYEWAQLAAEIGIVVASIALLIGSRTVWFASLALGAICAGALGLTYVRTTEALEGAERRIAAAAKNEQQLEADDEEEESAPAGSAAAPSGSGAPASGSGSPAPAHSAAKAEPER